MSTSDGDHAIGGEARLRVYLEELREDPPASDPHLTDRVKRHARWQQAVRGPLQAIGLLLAALAEGVTELIGADRGSHR